MSRKFDPGEILRELASTLDPSAVLRKFPGLTREDLSALIARAAEDPPSEGGEGTLRVDGAARGNPGPAGAGIVLEAENAILVREGAYLGELTNNAAEYAALLLGMERAASLGVRRLRVVSDSELMVRQLNGAYRVKSPALQELYFKAVKSASLFEKVTYEHTAREKNREADRLANMAIDARGRVQL